MNKTMNTFYNKCVIKWNFIKYEQSRDLQMYFDFALFLIIIMHLIMDITNLCQSIVDHMTMFQNGDGSLYMSGNPGADGASGSSSGAGSNLQGNSGIPNGSGGNPGPGGLPGGNTDSFGSYNTERRIVHDDGTWSNTIRSLFVYGSGGFRLWLIRNNSGTPVQRAFVIGGSILVDTFGRALQNTVNDPNSVLANIRTWQAI